MTTDPAIWFTANGAGGARYAVQRKKPGPRP